jgi:hypothetical protein
MGFPIYSDAHMALANSTNQGQPWVQLLWTGREDSHLQGAEAAVLLDEPGLVGGRGCALAVLQAARTVAHLTQRPPVLLPAPACVRVAEAHLAVRAALVLRHTSQSAPCIAVALLHCTACAGCLQTPLVLLKDAGIH